MYIYICIRIGFLYMQVDKQTPTNTKDATKETHGYDWS